MRKSYIVIAFIVLVLIVATATFFILLSLYPVASKSLGSDQPAAGRDVNDANRPVSNINDDVNQVKNPKKISDATMSFFKKGPGSILVVDPLGRNFGSTCDGKVFGTDEPENEGGYTDFYQDFGITEVVTIWNPIEGVYKRTFFACDESKLYDGNKFTILSESFLPVDGAEESIHSTIDSEAQTEVASRFILKEPEVLAPIIFESIDGGGKYLQRDMTDTPHMSSIDSMFWRWGKAFQENDIAALTSSFGYTSAEIEKLKNNFLWQYGLSSLITMGFLERKSDTQLDFKAFMVIRDKSNPSKDSELKNVVILIVDGKLFYDGGDIPGTIDGWQLYPSNENPTIYHSINEARDKIWAEAYPLYRKN